MGDESKFKNGSISPAPKTQAVTIQVIRDALVARAMKDVGVVLESQGKNRSPQIDRMNAWIGVPLGSSYCITAQQFNANEVCKALVLKNPIFRCAGTQDFVGHSSVQPYILPAGALGKKGCWASFIHLKDHSKGHEAMLAKDQLTHPLFDTVEYNTDSNGSRDGDGCWTHVRDEHSLSDLKFQVFIDVAKWIADANGIKI